jgi:hypothetical protein
MGLPRLSSRRRPLDQVDVIAATGQIWRWARYGDTTCFVTANLNGDDLVDFSAVGEGGILALMDAARDVIGKVVVGLACNNDQAGTEDVLLSSI